MRGSNGVNSTSGKQAQPVKKQDFEQSLARLEEIVRKLEAANLPLDDAMKLFEALPRLPKTARAGRSSRGNPAKKGRRRNSG
jgi:hypothetical protein